MLKLSELSKNSRTRLAFGLMAGVIVAWTALNWGSVLPEGLVEGTVAHAQDEAAATKGKPLLEYITDGGVIGYVIIICSLVGFSLAITFAFQLKRDALVPPEVLGEVERCFEEENYEEAYQICEGNPSFFSAILASGLAKIDSGYEEIEDAMIEAGEIESNKLHQKVGWLSLLASIAPMLGLFGTVGGMIATFNVIAISETQPEPAALAGGISIALMTTFLGLLVAIPMTIFYVIFKNKVVSTVLEVGALTEDLMGRFKGE